jgi:mRNA-degrading endonuclease RelE of RelBE toxin-antitoxin system
VAARFDSGSRLRVKVVPRSAVPIAVVDDTSKPPTTEYAGFWRCRIGDARVVYQPNVASRKTTLLTYELRRTVYQSRERFGAWASVELARPPAPGGGAKLGVLTTQLLLHEVYFGLLTLADVLAERQQFRIAQFGVFAHQDGAGMMWNH